MPRPAVILVYVITGVLALALGSPQVALLLALLVTAVACLGRQRPIVQAARRRRAAHRLGLHGLAQRL